MTAAMPGTGEGDTSSLATRMATAGTVATLHWVGEGSSGFWQPHSLESRSRVRDSNSVFCFFCWVWDVLKKGEILSKIKLKSTTCLGALAFRFFLEDNHLLHESITTVFVK